MSYNNRNWRNNDQRGANPSSGGDTRKPSTTVMVYSDASDDDVAFVSSYDTQFGRKSLISVCRKSGEVQGYPKFTELRRIKDVDPIIAIQTAKTVLAQMANGGDQDGEL